MDEGITKRLSFGEVSQHLNATQQLPVEDVIKALKMPSVENIDTYVLLKFTKILEKRTKILRAQSELIPN